MYSVALSHVSLRALKQQAELPAEIKRPLARLHRQWLALNKLHEGEYQRLDGLPDAWLNALQLAAAAISSYVSEHPTRLDEALQSFYFEALHFVRMAEAFGSHSICDLSRPPLSSASKPASTLSIRNIVPAPFLKERFAAAHCCTLFSATLQPARFYTDLLGLPDDTAWVEVESPFSAEQLTVKVARRISTRYQHRRASAPAIVALMAEQYSAQPGNYLAFFSSHDYLQEVAAAFTAAHPQIEVWAQDRRMSEQAQQGFLQRLTPSSQGIAFAVLGGSFSEGIDLPGKRLIGAFIATLGLPQLNPVNEQMRQRLDELLGAGYDYTYTYPGLQKVVQAAGRVIRTVSDAGVLHLMDDRFQRPEIRALLPRWWRVA
jgi:DNA excision repair protein ERCC-2